MLCILTTVTVEGAGRRPSIRALSRIYRGSGEAEVATAPLHGRVAAALGDSDDALRVVATASPTRRGPALVLAALHDLVLAGRAPALAAAYDRGDGEAAAAAAVDAIVSMADAVVSLVERRRPRTVEAARCAVLYPAVAEAARRAGARAVGLVDLAGSTGLTPHLDRIGITYDRRGASSSRGEPSSPVQIRSTVRGDRAVPERAMPEVVARVGVDPAPLDVTDPDDVRWLRACVGPDRPDRRAVLDGELALMAGAPPRLLHGEPLDALPGAVAAVPADALPVVVTTWTLSGTTREDRLRFLDRLDEVAARRAVAWVSVEGVGVAPAVPTLGDRPASGHSIVGVTLLDGPTVHAEAVGRCWSRGHWLSWIAGP